jgi:hypothetical protein
LQRYLKKKTKNSDEIQEWPHKNVIPEPSIRPKNLGKVPKVAQDYGPADATPKTSRTYLQIAF